MATPPLIMTERQALVALANLFQGIDQSSGEVTIEGDLANAIAVLAAGLVVSAAAQFKPGDLSPITLNPVGAVRVATYDAYAPLLSSGPWATGSPW